MEAINGFFDEFRFLSNFWPCKIEFDGYTYNSVEHAFQAAKTLNKDERAKVRLAYTPAAAKAAGQKVTIRSDWETVKDKYMTDFVLQKFTGDEYLGRKLIEIGNRHLEETNWWNDTYWGVCNGEGKNRLGEILMKVQLMLVNKENEEYKNMKD